MRFIYNKTFVAFFVCLCLLVFFMFLNSQGALDQIKRFFLRLPQPVVNFSGNLGRNTKSFFLALYDLKGMVKENAQLKENIALLEIDLAAAEADIRENEILRKELGFVKSSKLDLEPCEVLSANSLNLTDTLIINCGTDQGLLEGQVIISQGHIVGKIIYVGKTTSTAQIATSSKFLTDARISKTGQPAVVQGSYNSGMVIDQLPQSTQLEPGWLIVSGGINSKIPADLPIGEVGQIISSQNDLFKKASLLSPVDFNDLRFVYAVK
jgi:rod shape-determining protein MreC